MSALDETQQVFDGLDECVSVNRLHQDGGRSELLRSLAHRDVARFGQDDHACRRMLRSETNRLEVFESVGVEGDIEDQDVGLVVRDRLTELTNCGDPLDGVTFLGQPADDGLGMALLVLGKNDSSLVDGNRHRARWYPSGRPPRSATAPHRTTGFTIKYPLAAMAWEGIVDWWRRRSAAWSRNPEADPPLFRESRPVDANTRGFWGVEEDVELVGKPARPLAGLLAGTPQNLGRPRANPAFIEATFVELMRAGQYERAFAGLAPECRKAWGSARSFAAAHAGGSALKGLRGINVTNSRILEQWTDPARGTTHQTVAELDVEYLFGRAESPAVVPQTVHLISVAGKWCSLSYPPMTPTR